MKRSISLGVALFFAAGAAMAMHCPADMKKIDEALAKKPTLSAADAKTVADSRKKGEELHKAGKHQESVDELAKAMKILKIDAAAAAPKK